MLFVLLQKQMNFRVDRGFPLIRKRFSLVQKVLRKNDKEQEELFYHKKNDIHNRQEK